jgi:hypothetical protein
MAGIMSQPELEKCQYQSQDLHLIDLPGWKTAMKYYLLLQVF